MRFILVCFFSIAFFTSFSQKKNKNNKPKLVVGIVLDQMRWDYLYRFEPLFKNNGGFKRMMNEGFSCNNTLVPYTPTVTACGHTCIYTGSVPAIHGIVGNDWIDNTTQKKQYCTFDNNVKGVGLVKDTVGMQSPVNMFTTTICDELKLATNFKSKVIGIAAKDRGAILPAGHSANAAYWYNKENGNFISSTHYMQNLPAWVDKFNERKIVDSFYNLQWTTSLSNSIMMQFCDDDSVDYENTPFGKEQTHFPYTLSKFINKNYDKVLSTAYGNTLTYEFAKAAILNESLGSNEATDFLAISFSSTDYIGHSFGPNSWELLDCYVKIDEELGNLFSLLDKQLGKGNYTAFLTADHAVAHIPKYLQKHHIPAGTFEYKKFEKEINAILLDSFKVKNLVLGSDNYQVSLNNKAIKENQLNKEEICNIIIETLQKDSCVSNVFMLNDLQIQNLPNTIKQMLTNGYSKNRCGEIQFILKPAFIDGWSNKGTTHGLWNPYDAHIPLLWMGNGIKKGSSHKEVYMTDIAPTLAALLKIQMPNGCIGKVIDEMLK